MEDSGTTPRRRDGLHVRDLDGETVVLDVDGGQMHSLNPTASFIFARIDGNRTQRQIAVELARQYEVSPEDAERDTLRCIEQLRTLGIIA